MNLGESQVKWLGSETNLQPFCLAYAAISLGSGIARTPGRQSNALGYRMTSLRPFHVVVFSKSDWHLP